MPGFLQDEVHITRFVSRISKNESSMTRNTNLLVKFFSFLLILLVLETRSYDIESAMKRATVGPNVFLGSDGVKECDEELGITSGVSQVPDSAMSASSYNRNFPPHEGRLLSDKWWQPAEQKIGQYLMIDLQQLTVVRQSAVQGGRDPSFSGARVLSYFIYHSINGEDWFPILEREHVKLFVGNVESSELISRNYFPEPIMVRFVRFYPQRWRTFMALRVELYGCPAAFDPPVGMTSKAIDDSKISATSTDSTVFKPSYARLHLNIGGGGWCASLQNTDQYLQISLVDGYSSKYILTAVATQGVLTKKSWVKSYYFSYTLVSLMEWTFYHDSDKKKLFAGNTDENTVVTNHFMGFIVAREIRIHPQSWENSICLRVEVYGMDYISHRNDDICNYGADKIPKCRGFGKVCTESPSKMYQIFTCVCEIGFVGSTRTCEDLDECSVAYSLCNKKQYCFNGEGFTGCVCREGYIYDFYQGSCIDVDECAGHARDVCPYLTECINTDGSFICDCSEPGYLANGNNCLDIDECDIGSHTCLENSTCVNAAGSFRCFCNKGFTGDGSKACYDIDECETNYAECGTHGVCVNTIGSYYCVCKQGFVARGADCEDINECASDSAVCEHDALCFNLPGSYACQCKLGYQITDNACQDVNECLEELAGCDKRADCYNTVGSYLCVCNKGLYGNGFYCSNSELAGQCLEGDEECAAALSERARGKPNARKTAAALAEKARGKSKGRLKPGGASEKTQGEPNEKTEGKSNEKPEGKSNEKTEGKPDEKTQGNPNEKTQGNSNEKTQGKPNEKTQGNPNEKTQGKPNGR
ncbi:uncharacterized protein LOC144633182 isoform X3 [Oculina patagonica]